MAGASGRVQRVYCLAVDGGDGPPDDELLCRFNSGHDADAFAAIVRRHGPMVLSVCRALAPGEAEDVFQATFIVLARRAGSIRKAASLASWLHGVACRTARKAERDRARRARHEPRAARPEAVTDRSWREVQEVLHEELSGLSARHRAPLVLCYLEGKTLEEAAALLKVSKSTLKTRLERGRAALRARLVRRGLAPAVLVAAAWPGAAAAVPHPLIESTLGAVTGAAASPATRALAEGVLTAMHTNRLKVVAASLAILTAAGLTLAAVVAGPSGPVLAEEKQKGNDKAARVPADPAPPAAREFDEFTIATRQSAFSSELSATVRIKGDGTCWYEVEGKPAVGKAPAWGPARIGHKLPPERLGRFVKLLKETDWLAKPAGKKMQLHDPEHTLELTRGAKTVSLSCRGEHEPYRDLLAFLRGIASQEYLLYRLEWVPAAKAEARHLLDTYVRSELGQPQAKPSFEIDYARFAPWAKRLVRDPFDEPAAEVATAVRLVGLLKLESERESLVALASDRDRSVREAVAVALGRLGANKSVAVLRKMVRSTSEAAWELVKLGPAAVPAIAEVIENGDRPDESEAMVRAYLDHWNEVSRPLDAKVLEAVRASLVNRKAKNHRTEYHEELLKRAAGKEE